MKSFEKRVFILNFLLLLFFSVQALREPFGLLKDVKSPEINALNLKEAMISGQRVNLNEIGVLDLERVPGIGKVLAQRIVQDRKKHGFYENLEEMKRVRGIGPSKIKTLSRFLVVLR